MKKRRKALAIILFLLGSFAVLAIILVVRTMTHPFPEYGSDIITDVEYYRPDEAALERFAGGICIPTISTQDYSQTDFEPFDRFKEYLRETYPQIYETTENYTVNDYGLVFRWKGRNGSLDPILFLSHYDVVPVLRYDGEADEDIVFSPWDDPAKPLDEISDDWDYPAFSGAVADGRIYGRGTLDMKGMLFGIMEGASQLMYEGFVPERDIYFAFGHDEEVGGLQGAVKIAEHFRERQIVFDAVYDEGGIIEASGLGKIDRPIALIGIGEKGFLTIRITVYGLGGHSSMPPKKGSLVLAAEIINKLNENQMPAQIIPPIRNFLDNFGSEQGFAARMAIANGWLFDKTLLNTLESDPASNALIRTTTAITMAKGSDAANVMSSASKITVNFRILPGESVADVMEHVRKICEGYEVDILVVNEREPSALSPENVNGYEIIKRIVSELYPQAMVSSYITIGGTDAYKYQIVSNNIYRFMPVMLNSYEQRVIHNENEHISIENYGKMINYFREVMRSYDR